jgi:hypothetical protein
MTDARVFDEIPLRKKFCENGCETIFVFHEKSDVHDYCSFAKRKKSYIVHEKPDNRKNKLFGLLSMISQEDACQSRA